MGGREVDLVPGLEYKGSAAVVGILFLPILRNSDKSLSLIYGCGNICEKIVSCGGVGGGWFEETTGREGVLSGV
jgi:hypothetical protein